MRPMFSARMLRATPLALALCSVLPVAHAQSVTYTRTEETVYADNTSLWVLSQVAQTKVDGVVASATTYDPTYAVPLTRSQFGKLQQTLTYDTTATVLSGQRGTVKTVKDGNNNITTAINWKRGIPQSITYADSTTESAEVNDLGWITGVIDENGYKTCYDYDAMGRISQITYPSETVIRTCDVAPSNPTTQAFAKINSTEYGIPAGHWRQTVTTGNGKKVVYFDALWRPLVTREYDAANELATQRFQRFAYDYQGRTTFASYAGASDALTTGIWTEYDPLGRPTSVSQDSELGVLTTLTEYLPGFQVRVTNPRGVQTATQYQAWDQPTTEFPVGITTYAGADTAATEIDRDSHGKPIAITRRNSDGSLSLTRSYTYNAQQELCRSVEPETGATLMGYDAAGNLAWSASGLSATAPCDAEGDTAEILARKAIRTYDARNRVATLTFSGGNGDTGYGYYPDGRLQSLTAYNNQVPVTSTYTYNRRRLLTNERLQWANGATSIDWPIDYTYNANGHLATQSWHGLTVDYVPNALGQPTRAGTFATGVSYYSNGAIKQFTYGNGIVHTMTPNARGLPATSNDAYGASSLLDDDYTYDANGNVLAINDGLPAMPGRPAGHSTRTMTYDALDRLKTTVSPMFDAIGDQTARYSYDALDNLTHVLAPGRDHYYCYEAASGRLAFLRSGPVCTGGSANSALSALQYDVQGNLNDKDGTSYAFDFGNRLRTVTAAGATGPTSQYAYDGHGRRVWDRTTDDKYSHYTLEGRLVMTGDNRQGVVAEYIYLGGSLVAIRERDVPTNQYATKYQHVDALGSPVAVTNESRIEIERFDYEPFGRVLKPLNPSDGPGYTGHVFDSGTGLNYMQQRYYDPTIGRFLSIDPVTAYEEPGQNFNRYWYGNNNPYLFTDPDGRAPAWMRGFLPYSTPKNMRDQKLVAADRIRGEDGKLIMKGLATTAAVGGTAGLVVETGLAGGAANLVQRIGVAGEAAMTDTGIAAQGVLNTITGKATEIASVIQTAVMTSPLAMDYMREPENFNDAIEGALGEIFGVDSPAKSLVEYTASVLTGETMDDLGVEQMK